MSNETKQFEWTDELVREVVGIARKDGYHSIQETNLDSLVENFKKSKSIPKQRENGWYLVMDDRKIWYPCKFTDGYWWLNPDFPKVNDTFFRNINEVKQPTPTTASIPNKQDEIRIAELEKELDVTESLLNERKRILDAIPECEAHGKCVPHALDWVEMKKSKIYSQSEVDTIRKETWDEGRKLTSGLVIGGYMGIGLKYPTLQDYLNSLSKETKPKEEDKPVIIEDNDRCGICGGEMVYIRGRYPNTDKRKVCPTCTTERLEQISDLCSPEYGKAYQNKN